MDSTLIPFHVEVEWIGDQMPKKLTYKTSIEGAKEHDITVVSPYQSLGECVCYY